MALAREHYHGTLHWLDVPSFVIKLCNPSEESVSKWHSSESKVQIFLSKSS